MTSKQCTMVPFAYIMSPYGATVTKATVFISASSANRKFYLPLQLLKDLAGSLNSFARPGSELNELQPKFSNNLSLTSPIISNRERYLNL